MVTFTSCRSKPELVAPARPTPHETKALSDVDSKATLRFYTTAVEFFRCRPGHRRPEYPAKLVKSALSEALVYYYPLAGRLRELRVGGEDKMVVECTGEGVVFVEATADVGLPGLGEPLVPPYPCVGELMCDAGDTAAVFGKPLLFMQMTLLKCGGFVIALTMCHSIVDAFGIVQLLGAIGDLSRGETLPTVLPVWERHLLTAHPPYPPCEEPAPHDGDTDDDDVMLTTPLEHMVVRSFLFSSTEIAAMRNHLPPPLRRSATMFELLTAVVWRCRTAALAYAPDRPVRLMFTSNARGSWKRDRPLPRGFYGNALFSPVTAVAAGELCGSPLGRALELVRAAKFRVTDEYVRTELAKMARGLYRVSFSRTFVVSDVTGCRDDMLDFGWAERVGGGAPMAGSAMAMLLSYYMRTKNTDGEECVVVPMCLPRPAMERFAAQIADVVKVSAAQSSL